MARDPLLSLESYAGSMKKSWGRWAVAALVAVLALSTGCGNDSSESQPVEGLVLCENVPELGSRVKGNLGSRMNVDDDVMDVIRDYRQEHQETHGGLWIDRDNGGAIVLAATDDPEAHRRELQDRLSGLDAVIDVVQVEFTKIELLEIQKGLGQYMGPEFGFLSMGIPDSQNRVSLDFYDPPEGTLEMFAELVDPAAVCITVTYSPELPSGPLALIPDLDMEDPLVTCKGLPPVPYSKLSIPVPVNDVDRPCKPVVEMPDGLNRVAIRLDPDSLPNPEDAAIQLLVTETSCANGREMGDALLGPQVIETDDAVLLAFAAVGLIGPANCPGNPSTSVIVELSQPLGQRTLYDGVHVPPKALSVEEDW